MAEVISLIDDLNDFKTRAHARAKLIELGPDKAGEALLELLRKDSTRENVVWSAITAINSWKWERAKEDLVDLLEKRPNLQGDILKTLQKVTGASHGYDIQIWRMEVSEGGILEKIMGLFNEEEALETRIVNSSDHEDYCVIKLAIEGGRKQKVSVLPKEEFYEIYTEAGMIDEHQVESVDVFANNYPDISISCEKDEDKFRVCLTRSCPKENLSYSYLKEIIMNLGQVADYAEKHLTEDDKI